MLLLLAPSFYRLPASNCAWIGRVMQIALAVAHGGAACFGIQEALSIGGCRAPLTMLCCGKVVARWNTRCKLYGFNAPLVWRCVHPDHPGAHSFHPCMPMQECLGALFILRPTLEYHHVINQL